MLKLSEQVQRLLCRLVCENSHIDELDGRGLPNSYFNLATEFNIVDLLVLLLWGFQRYSELKEAIRRRFDNPRLRVFSPSYIIRRVY